MAAKQGLCLDTRDYPDPQAIVHAYLRGELDVAQLTTVEAVYICSKQPNRCPVVVLVLDESRGGDMVAARGDLLSVEDLRGRKVAVTPSTLGPFVLSRALQEAGMALKDVQVVPMPMGEMVGSLARRKVVFGSSRIPGEIFDVPRLLRTWQAAHEYADRYPDEADKLMAFREKLSVPRFRQAEQGLVYYSLQE